MEKQLLVQEWKGKVAVRKSNLKIKESASFIEALFLCSLIIPILLRNYSIIIP
jgi:hypothetical protein